jgi:hypothetical protein
VRLLPASKFSKSLPESDQGRQSLAPARRVGSHPAQGIGRLRRRYRPRYAPPGRRPQSGRLIQDRGPKGLEHASELVDDFPQDIAVLTGELKVIETYLAGFLDESLEPRAPKRDDPASEDTQTGCGLGGKVR